MTWWSIVYGLGQHICYLRTQWDAFHRTARIEATSVGRSVASRSANCFAFLSDRPTDVVSILVVLWNTPHCVLKIVSEREGLVRVCVLCCGKVVEITRQRGRVCNRNCQSLDVQVHSLYIGHPSPSPTRLSGLTSDSAVPPTSTYRLFNRCKCTQQVVAFL